MLNQKTIGFSVLGTATVVTMTFAVQLSHIETANAETGSRSGDTSRGATLWTQNCARCHNMRDPKEFRDDLWKPIVTHMRIRAGLTGQDSRDILAFLQASN